MFCFWASFQALSFQDQVSLCSPGWPWVPDVCAGITGLTPLLRHFRLRSPAFGRSSSFGIVEGLMYQVAATWSQCWKGWVTPAHATSCLLSPGGPNCVVVSERLFVLPCRSPPYSCPERACAMLFLSVNLLHLVSSCNNVMALTSSLWLPAGPWASLVKAPSHLFKYSFKDLPHDLPKCSFHFSGI